MRNDSGMSPVGWTAPGRSATYGDPTGPLSRIAVAGARFTLLLYVLVVYSGALVFLITFSPALLYGSYVIVCGCVATILFFERDSGKKLLSSAPYVCWLLIVYCAWGSLVTVGSVPADEVAKLFLKNAIVLAAFSLAVVSLRDLKKAASWLQVIVLLNVAICIQELSDRDLILTLARAVDPLATAYDLQRCAGLWRNPDEASFAFIFGFLIAHWANRPMAWIGRLACVAGIFMTASRTGAYVIVGCCAVSLLSNLRPKEFSRRLTSISLAAAMLAVTGLALSRSSFFDDLANQRQIRRILDPTEHSDRASGAPSRLEIARAALDRACERPFTGFGIFSYEDLRVISTISAGLVLGAHNIFLIVFGETGIFGFLTYLFILGWGLRRAFYQGIRADDRLVLVLMWLSYIVIGFAWHNQFIDFGGMLYVSFLYHLPVILRRSGDGIQTAVTEIREAAFC
jgi:O-antigen ligase